MHPYPYVYISLPCCNKPSDTTKALANTAWSWATMEARPAGHVLVHWFDRVYLCVICQIREKFMCMSLGPGVCNQLLMYQRSTLFGNTNLYGQVFLKTFRMALPHMFECKWQKLCILSNIINPNDSKCTCWCWRSQRSVGKEWSWNLGFRLVGTNHFKFQGDVKRLYASLRP